MGSVLISDVVTDIARFPHTMVIGDVHQTSSTSSDFENIPSTRSRSSTATASPYTPQSTLSRSGPHSESSNNTSQNTQIYTQSSTERTTPHIHGSGARNSHATSGTPAQYSSHQHSEDTPVVHSADGSRGYDQSGFPLSTAPGGLASSPPSPRLQPTLRSSLSLAGSVATSPSRIKVRDLSHIQSFASEEVLARSHHGSRRSLRSRHEPGQQYEISAMPVADIIEMVAGLLTKITTTNDRQHEHVHRHIPPAEGTSGLSQQTTSVLAFHGKNVPSITILSYLSRIHKYCPTTYEVFLSLLVYFDRMTEIVNSGTLSSFQRLEDPTRPASRSGSRTGPGMSEHAAMDDNPSLPGTPQSGGFPRTEEMNDKSSDPSSSPNGDSELSAHNLSHFFVVDSFNIHRLVIAGVTCASKFFSDVFYTNSRYAKVSNTATIKANMNVNAETRSIANFFAGRRITPSRIEPFGTSILTVE